MLKNKLLSPLSSSKAERIVSNILDACRDINLLSPESYRWLNTRAGFIAHFDLRNFIADYQDSNNLRENILAWEHRNTHCNRSEKDKEYTYYLQQCQMYTAIVEALKADPDKYVQKKRTDNFFIDITSDGRDDLHRITLSTRKGTLDVYADRTYLQSLASNIHNHLQQSELLKKGLS